MPWRGDKVYHNDDDVHHRGDDVHHRGDDVHHRGDDVLHRGDDVLHRGDDVLHREDDVHHRSDEVHHRSDGYYVKYVCRQYILYRLCRLYECMLLIHLTVNILKLIIHCILLHRNRLFPIKHFPPHYP